MKHLHLECIGGASGDMMLGALIELGAPREAVERALSSLGTAKFSFSVERGESMHMAGVRLQIKVEGHPEAAEPAEPHDAHPHDHHHAHDHASAPAPHRHHHHHDHRSLTEIKEMIGRSSLPESVKVQATHVFTLLGRAEAKIHGVPLEQIHFHEVGADDSILDVVGSCLALHHLGITTVSTGPLPQGQGTIRCAHGVYPNPAPATLELTAGMAVVQTDEPFELITPTGAALLRGFVNAAMIPGGAVLATTAYSLGRRHLHHRPNLLRASIYNVVDHAGTADECLMMECNLDDTTPELIGALMDDLLSAGALDVTCAPVTMKKQRPGVVLSVLAAPAQREQLLEVIFRGSTTFGVREYAVQRTKLERRFESVPTAFGPVKIKIGRRAGVDLTRAPEFEDCRRIAREQGVSVRAVYEAAMRANESGPAV